MNFRFSILDSRLLLAFAACVATAQADDLVQRAVGARPATAILRTMLNPTPETQRLPDVTYVAGYEVLGAPVAIPAAGAAKLGGLVGDPDAFARPPADEKEDPGTAYRPGVVYRFGTPPDSADLLVCFSCDKVAIVPAGATSIAGIRDITQPARDVLLDLAREMLPDDEALQALPRVRSRKPVPPPPVPVPQNPTPAGE